MSAMMQAVALTETIDAGRQLHLDRDLPIGGPTRVRVILLYPVLPSPSFLRKQESIRVFALSTSLMDSCFRRNDGLGSYRYPLDDDWQEQDWLLAAASNPAFEYLREASEDVYSLEDGKPISDQD